MEDCRPLVEKILARIKSWVKFFILLAKIHKKINAKLKALFWNSIDLNHLKVKIVWEDIYASKKEDMLGILRNGEWNKKAIAKHV